MIQKAGKKAVGYAGLTRTAIDGPILPCFTARVGCACRLRLDRDDTLDLDRDLVWQHDVADRGAGMPSSPNTSTNRSEQPLMTFGESLKFGTALTMPSSLTMKSTRSSEPSASRMAARSPSPTRRARR